MLKAEMVVTVIGRGHITVRAIDAQSNGIGELYTCSIEGQPEYVAGNFENQRDLDPGLAKAMTALQAAALEVMKQLQQQQERSSE